MGRCEGLSDAQWQVMEPLLPRETEKRSRGYPHAPWRLMYNTIFYDKAEILRSLNS